jgi:hypothetical protein
MLEAIIKQPEIIVIFLSGFVTIKVLHIFHSPLEKDFSKSIYDVLAFGIINYAIYYEPARIWLFNKWNPFLINIALFLVAPAITAYVIYAIRNRTLRISAQEPYHSAWEYFFLKRKPHTGVIVHFKDGEKVCGEYGENSYSSSPYDKDIYLEKLYFYDGDNAFAKEMTNTNGAWIPIENVKLLEFIKPGGNHEQGKD